MGASLAPSTGLERSSLLAVLLLLEALIVRYTETALLCPCQQSLDIGNNEMNSAQAVSAPIRGLNKAHVGILQRRAQAALIVSLTVALVKLTS